MTLIAALRTALRAIAANRLRTALTTLGMVIGVGSVIVLIAVGQGAQKGVQDRIRGLGTNLIFVRPAPQQNVQTGARGAQGSGFTLTQADAEAIAQAQLPGVAGVAPQVSLGGAQAIVSGNNLGVTIIGTTRSYSEVRSAAVAEGAFVTDQDVERRALTVVLGSDVAKALFPDGGAIGETVRLAIAGGRIGLNFRVVGVMEQRGGSAGGEQDGYVFVPVTTMQARLSFQRSPSGAVNVNQINIQTADGVEQVGVVAAVTDLLMQRHAVGTPDFTVQTQDDLLGAAGEVSRTLSILLGSIAGISLVVGGIGVMNIMLVSVTERVREIGIRRAVGARRRDVMLQFTAEALALTVGGGAIGIAVGIGVALGVDGREISGQSVTTVIQPWSVAVAFAVAAGIGLLSGSYPAFRASRLDPIAALRNE